MKRRRRRHRRARPPLLLRLPTCIMHVDASLDASERECFDMFMRSHKSPRSYNYTARFVEANSGAKNLINSLRAISSRARAPLKSQVRRIVLHP